jgi:hypothetical protein
MEAVHHPKPMEAVLISGSIIVNPWRQYSLSYKPMEAVVMCVKKKTRPCNIPEAPTLFCGVALSVVTIKIVPSESPKAHNVQNKNLHA